MGADYLVSLGTTPGSSANSMPDGATTAADTRRIAAAMAGTGVDLLAFVGGDGTARDVCDVVDARLPVVAVPAGVKAYSGAFALSPGAAGAMVDAFVEGVDVTEVEVLDIDEDAFRDDRLAARSYGFLLAPNVQSQIQPGKEGAHMTPDALENKHEIAGAFVEQMDDDVLYLLGPGTTVRAVADALGVEKTLLGIDAVLGGNVVGRDLNEREILVLLALHSQAEIVVTPLGGNGFIFGRGNKPFTPAVIRRVGLDHVAVIATEEKARQVGVLRVDTGDPALDAQLNGYRQVMIGYDIARAMKVVAV